MDADQRAIGVEMNGHVWDGDKWVPIPPRPAESGQHLPPMGGPGAPRFQAWPQRGPKTGGFSDPNYGYGFTRQTSDDLQFIARFYKVMIIIWIVLMILGVIVVPLTIGSVFAAIGGLLSHTPR